MKYLSILFLTTILLMSCGSDSSKQAEIAVTEAEMEADFSKCPHNEPIPPIFTKDSTGYVVDQSHELFKGHIEEKVVFSDGIKLELRQSGCNVLKQNYQFTFPENVEEDNPQFWMALAMGQFEKMANVEEGFLNIAQLIYQNGGQMKLGEPLNSSIPMGEGYGETNYMLMIDRFTEGEQPLLVVNFDLVYPK